MGRGTREERPIIAEGLVRRFGEIVAVDGIDLSVEEGEIFGFLGPNGAGKSTTVRVLTTLLRPSAGRARVAGHDVLEDPDGVRRSIGVALQEAALDPLMTGRELLALQAVLHGMSKPEGRRRGEELLELVGLVAAADRRVGTYSAGMRRRLDLALGLVHEPRVLFLDEPTTGLDPTSRVTLWDEVRRLNADRGVTIFLTTQYMEEADQLAGRIAIIDEGRIVAEGTPARLKAGVGEPTLTVALAPEVDRAVAGSVVASFGEPVPSGPGNVALRLPGGSARIPAVIRALDEAGVGVEGIDLHAPSLNDVFIAATGRRLEGAEGTGGAGSADGLDDLDAAPAGAETTRARA